jgi:hypothetical protein
MSVTHEFVVRVTVDSDREFKDILKGPVKLAVAQALDRDYDNAVELVETRHNAMCMCLECMGK